MQKKLIDLKLLSKKQFVLIIFFSLIIFLSLDLGGRAETIDTLQFENIIHTYSLFKKLGFFCLIFTVLGIIASIQLIMNKNKSESIVKINFTTIIYFALPLIVSATLFWLSYWPANANYDSSLQWYQAITRGNLSAPLVISATLFLRLFSYFSKNPALVIMTQIIFSAFGVALILKELCYRGVPIWTAQIFSILIAIQPQYPTFFTNLGKDALSAIGIIFFAWTLLSTTRELNSGKTKYFSLIFLIISAVFAGMMRFNILPATILTVFTFVCFLFFRRKKILSYVVLFVYLFGLIYVPKISFALSDEQRTINTDKNLLFKHTQKKESYFDAFVFLYLYHIYHLFSAAVHNTISIEKSEEDLFLEIAPRNAWAQYNCFMTDTTMTSLNQKMILNQEQYLKFLADHKIDMVKAVSSIIKKHPSVLIDREICITKILWNIGYKQKPFQTTATLGYDSVLHEFKQIVGNNRSLLANKFRIILQKYISWTEAPSHFWFFWKPALFFYIGLFCICFRLTLQRDDGYLFIVGLALSIVLILAILIPFPAYRYVYPATLLMTLLCALTFSKTNYTSSKLNI